MLFNDETYFINNKSIYESIIRDNKKYKWDA